MDGIAGGLIPGILTTAFCGTTAFTGLYLLSRSAGKTADRGASFSSLAAVTFPSLARLFDLAIFLKCFGVSVSYLIVVGSLMPRGKLFSLLTTHAVVEISLCCRKRLTIFFD